MVLNPPRNSKEKKTIKTKPLKKFEKMLREIEEKMSKKFEKKIRD